MEIGFRGVPGCSRGIWIYIGGGSTSVDQQGTHEGGGRALGGAPPTSWPPLLFLDVGSKSPGSYSS